MTETDDDGFESFPRGRLSLRWDRRQLFGIAASQVRILSEPGRWGATQSLADLGRLSDGPLEALVPVVATETRIAEKEGAVWGYLRGTGCPVRLFTVGSPAASVFEHFDGRTTLGAIARELAQQRGWDPSRAFRYLRGLFLHLVTLGVCKPR